jgi:hypothetical protein
VYPIKSVHTKFVTRVAHFTIRSESPSSQQTRESEVPMEVQHLSHPSRCIHFLAIAWHNLSQQYRCKMTLITTRPFNARSHSSGNSQLKRPNRVFLRIFPTLIFSPTTGKFFKAQTKHRQLTDGLDWLHGRTQDSRLTHHHLLAETISRQPTYTDLRLPVVLSHRKPIVSTCILHSLLPWLLQQS